MRRMFSLKQLQEIADSEVEKLVESGTLNNAKPIYWHSISMTSPNTPYDRLTCLIFNNSRTPFTKETFLSFIKVLATELQSTSRIMVSGGFTIDNVVYPVSYLYSFNGGDIGLACAGAPSFSGYENWLLEEEQIFSDSVNKIN